MPARKRGRPLSADYAMLLEGKPYKNGGTSLTEGAGFFRALPRACWRTLALRCRRLSADSHRNLALRGNAGVTPKKFPYRSSSREIWYFTEIP
ncbi:MAG: hypothetical protein ACLR2E_03180 [Lachnospiraceae bacterium]